MKGQLFKIHGQLKLLTILWVQLCKVLRKSMISEQWKRREGVADGNKIIERGRNHSS